jgi:D-alanyl-D-alanine carboxypeptidase
VTSARDLAMLARALIREFPEYDYYWHLPGIKFGRRVMRNYNKLIDLYPGADGMKTGFICASGFNLVASATRNNRRLIAVVLGAPSASVRAYKAAKLLEQGFNSGSSPLNWLIPASVNVEDLKPIEASPPNLRDEVCGPRRKRPAAEDEEVDFSASGDSPMAFVLASLRGGTAKASALLGTHVAMLPPVEVFVGAVKPNSAAAAEAQESQIVGGARAKRAKKGKPDKKAKSAVAAAKPAPDAKPAAATAAAKPATPAGAPKPKVATASAKPAAPAAKPAAATGAAKPAAGKPQSLAAPIAAQPRPAAARPAQ